MAELPISNVLIEKNPAKQNRSGGSGPMRNRKRRAREL
jgi:hypothetical protein